MQSVQKSFDLLEPLIGICNGSPERVGIVMVIGQAYQDYVVAEKAGLIKNGKIVVHNMTRTQKKTGGMEGAVDLMSAIRVMTTRSLERLLEQIGDPISAGWIRKKGGIPLLEA